MNTYKWDCRNVEVYTTYTDGQGNTEPLVIFKVNWEILVCDETGNATTIGGVEELNIGNLDNFANELLADQALNTFINPVTQELMLQD